MRNSRRGQKKHLVEVASAVSVGYVVSEAGKVVVVAGREQPMMKRGEQRDPVPVVYAAAAQRGKTATAEVSGE